jgi:hypothetical protein
MRGSGIRREFFFVASKNRDDVVKPRTEPTRDDERIAAVVSRSGEHNHRAAAITEHRACDFGGSQASALHQRRVRVTRFERPQLRDPDDGLKV